MGQTPSTEKKVLIIKKKELRPVKLHIPYSKLNMLRILQKQYQYEIKGALYFDNTYKFKSFEIRTDESSISSTGENYWKLMFHTHPYKTSKIYGIKYFSPPSVDDIMEIYDRIITQSIPDMTRKLGEISLILANEGVYVIQADRDLFEKSELKYLTDTQLETYLTELFSDFMVDWVKSRIKKLYGAKYPNTVPDYINPKITADELDQILTSMSTAVTRRFGFKLTFKGWKSLEKSGLFLITNTYFVGGGT